MVLVEKIESEQSSQKGKMQKQKGQDGVTYWDYKVDNWWQCGVNPVNPFLQNSCVNGMKLESKNKLLLVIMIYRIFLCPSCVNRLEAG